MPLWRRREPLHEKLAREGGLAPPAAEEPEPYLPPFVAGRHAIAGEAAVHGVPRPRRYDAVATVEAHGIPGDAVHFVALSDGTLVVDEDVPEGAVPPLADALEEMLDPPYRAEAVRQGESLWAVAATTIEVVEIPQAIDGDELELTVAEGARTLVVDGEPSFGSVPSLERIASARFDAFAARARRIDGDLWELRLTPL